MPKPLYILSVAAQMAELRREWGISSLVGTAGGVHVEGANLVKKNIEELKGNIISQCAMQSKNAAKGIYDFSYRICPEKTGELKKSGRISQVDAMDSLAVTEGLVWPEGVGPATFTFPHKQRTVWEVSYGNETVDYAAVVHEGLAGVIHREINPEAESHWLKKGYDEFDGYFERRIVERVQAEIMKAGARAASSVAVSPVSAEPVYDDEVPF